MSRAVDGHSFESVGQACRFCATPESIYDDEPVPCAGAPAARGGSGVVLDMAAYAAKIAQRASGSP